MCSCWAVCCVQGGTGQFTLDDLVARGLLFSTDCSALMLMEHKGSEEIFTVSVTRSVKRDCMSGCRGVWACVPLSSRS